MIREKEWEWTIDEYKKHIKETPMRGNAIHYENKNGEFDVLDFIQAYELNFATGNVIKYLCRKGKKANNSELQDLYKAKDYLDREIQRVRDLDQQKTKEWLEDERPKEDVFVNLRTGKAMDFEGFEKEIRK